MTSSAQVLQLGGSGAKRLKRNWTLHPWKPRINVSIFYLHLLLTNNAYSVRINLNNGNEIRMKKFDFDMLTKAVLYVYGC